MNTVLLMIIVSFFGIILIMILRIINNLVNFVNDMNSNIREVLRDDTSKYKITDIQNKLNYIVNEINIRKTELNNVNNRHGFQPSINN